MDRGRNAFGEHDAVNPDLNVGVFVSDMETGIGNGRVVGHPGHLQDDFVDRRVVTLRQIFDRFAGYAVGRGADSRQQIIARLIEAAHLGVQRLLRGSGPIRCRGGGGRALRRVLRRPFRLRFLFRSDDYDFRDFALPGCRRHGVRLRVKLCGGTETDNDGQRCHGRFAQKLLPQPFLATHHRTHCPQLTLER